MANRDKVLGKFSSKFKTRKGQGGDARNRSESDRKRDSSRRNGRHQKMMNQGYED